jgi:hypothetical protein
MLSSMTSSEILLPSSVQCSLPFFRGRMKLPPSVNEAYTLVRIHPKDGEPFNRIGPSKKLERFKADAAAELLGATCDRSVVKAIYESYEKERYVPLVVSVRFFFREMWKRDVDGGLKFVVDAAFEAMGLNDKLVVKVRDLDKEVNRRDPHAEIDVCCLLQK